MVSVLVTGASRGIGLALVQSLLELPEEQVGFVWAAARVSNSVLDELNRTYPRRFRTLQLDLCSQNSVQQAVGAIQKSDMPGGLDIVINNAGIMGKKLPVTDLEPEDLLATFETNVIGVQRVTKAVLPLLRKGSKKMIINISAGLASMGAEMVLPSGVIEAVTAYRCSKTALNMLTRQWSVALQSQGFTIFALHPGWVRTDMGGPLAPVLPEDIAKAIVNIVFEKGIELNGMFLHVVPTKTGQENNLLSVKTMPW